MLDFICSSRENLVSIQKIAYDVDIYSSFCSQNIYLIEMFQGLVSIKSLFPFLLPRANGPQLHKVLLNNATLSKSFSSSDGSQPPPENPASIKTISVITTNFKKRAPKFNQPPNPSLCLVIRNFYSNNSKKSKQNDFKGDSLSLKPKNLYMKFVSPSSNYESIIESGGEDHVDKSTDLIKIHILSPSSMVTNYRRSGKSTMASMINAFYNIAFAERVEKLLTSQKQVNSQLLQKEISETQHPYYQFFSKQKIGQFPQIMKEQGKYPVIFMEFIDIYVPGDNFETFYSSLRIKIQQTYKEYPYLKENPEYIKMMKMFERVNQQNIDQISAYDKTLIRFSLFKLTQLLQNFHHERVIVLIDEYDSSFNEVLYQEFDLVCQKFISQLQYNALENPSLKQKEDHDEKIRILEQKKKQLSQLRMKIIRHIVSVLGPVFKYNRSLKKGILFGIFQTAITNNISVSNMINSDLSSSFGLQQEEIRNYVDSMFQQSQNRTKLLNNIKKYCNGYISRQKDKNGKQVKIYNVFSTMNYIHSCFEDQKIVQYEKYWIQSGSKRVFKLFFCHKGLFFLKNRILSMNRDIVTPIPIETNANLAQFPFQSGNLSDEYMTYLLHATGLITGEVNQDILQARIPNQQILNVFKNEFMYWARKSMGISELQVNLLDLKQTIAIVHQHLVQYQRRGNPQFLETALQTVVLAIQIFSGSNKLGLYQEKWVSTEDMKKCDHIFVPVKIIEEENKKAENEQTESDKDISNEDESFSIAEFAEKQCGGVKDEETVIIQQYQRRTDQNIHSLYIKGFHQILTKGHILAICKLQGKQYVPKHPSVKKVVLRSIVVAEEKGKPCYLYHNKQDVVISIEQALKLAELANKYFQESEEAVKAVFKRKANVDVDLDGKEYGRVKREE